MTTNYHPVSLALLFSTLGLALSLSGCAVEASASVPAETVYEAEPPPPPPVVQEAPPPPPGPEYVWIGGFHRWNGRQYVWVRGRYDRRPHGRARWEVAHWEMRGRSHVWIEGRWR